MADDALKIEIFGDSPTTEDGLGFDDYVNVLLELVGNFDPNIPLTIGIHGRWGSGKTSLMMMLDEGFRAGEGVRTIWFNAWAHGKDEPIGLALMHHILIEFQDEGNSKEQITNLLESTGGLLFDAALRKATGMSLGEAKEHFKNSIKVKNALRHDFETVIGECLQDGGKLVVFIDDLDRCLPENTIEILEAIKLFLDVSKCIFVIGVEKEVIEKGIEVRYKSKEQELPIRGEEYIEKIIQIPFTLPPIRDKDMAAFIENLGIGRQEKGYAKIVLKVTGCTPRKVKRFLNASRIRRAIVERIGEGIEPDLSVKLFVFKYVFPEFYEDVVEYPYLLYDLERLARGDSDEELERVLKHSELMRKYHKDEDLSSLLRDGPFFCGIDIEPYIYLSGTEASQEVAASDESILDELLSGDYMKMKRTVDAINKMSDSDKQRFLNLSISKLKDDNMSVRKNAAEALGAIGDPRAFRALDEALKDKDASVLGAVKWALEQIKTKQIRNYSDT